MARFTGVSGIGSADTGDITFDGIKIIGAGDASGDGYGNGTMELVPDNDLYNNDQYLVIDPTVPSHIHIRSGGTQDDSNAELFLGGEKTHVRIIDSFGSARMQASYTYNNTYYSGDWTSAVVTEDGSNRTLEITDPAQYILDFLNSSDWNNASQVSIGFDGGERGFIYGQNSTESTLTFFLELTGTPSEPTAISSLELYYEQRSRVDIDMNDDQELAIVGNGVDVNIFSSDDISITANDGINIESGNNIAIDAEDNIVLYSAEGGHFLQSSESPNNQIATIGDLVTDLDGLSDVAITGTPTDKQLLVYDNVTSQWKNQDPITASGIAYKEGIPASKTSTGTLGQLAIDGENGILYICTSTNNWQKVSLNSATFSNPGGFA